MERVAELAQLFESLGDTLREAEKQYVQAKQLDEPQFGEDYQ